MPTDGKGKRRESVTVAASRMASRNEPEQYVVVSIAPNGVVHVWGDNESRPFDRKEDGRLRAVEMLAADKRMYPGPIRTIFKVCRILGKPPEQDGDNRG